MSHASGEGREPSVSGVVERMAAMPAGYADLLASAGDAARADDRVLALWVGGSIAPGGADAGSDLDLLVAVQDDAFEDFAAGAVDPLDLTERVPPGNDEPGPDR